MRKVLTVAIVFVMLMAVAVTVVNASSVSTLPDELYAIGQKYGMTAKKKADMESYLADHSLSNAECDRILALAQQADQIMKDNNTTNFKTLPADVKEQLKSLANQAADIAGVTLNFKSNDIEVYQNGELIEVISGSSASGKLAYTGNDNVALVVSSIAVIALAATTMIVATKKRLAANA